jgi:uncharacterized membrane protein
MSDPAGENIRTIIDLERQALRESTLGERIGDAISRAVGSMTFVAIHAVALLAWIGWNTLLPEARRFDPYPFGLLTFIVSLEGVLIATFVLIAQNRMSRESEERAHLTLQVDLLAEQEMTLVLRMLRRISERLGVEALDKDEARAEQLTEQTNVYELVKTLRQELPAKRKSS